MITVQVCCTKDKALFEIERIFPDGTTLKDVVSSFNDDGFTIVSNLKIK